MARSGPWAIVQNERQNHIQEKEKKKHIPYSVQKNHDNNTKEKKKKLCVWTDGVGERELIPAPREEW